MFVALPYVVIHYAIWHYTEAVRELVIIWRNIIWFFWNLFSVPLLLRTLFSPWHRIQERVKTNSLDLEQIGGAIVVNIIMRIVGFCARLMIASIGLFCITVAAITAVSSIIVWLLFPLIIPGLISVGLTMLVL